MAMTADDIRRHPAYKYGFEGHRKYSELDRPNNREDLVSPGPWKDQTTRFPGESFGPYDLWLMGSHAGMENGMFFHNRGSVDANFWRTNPEPIYDEEKGHVQLELF